MSSGIGDNVILATVAVRLDVATHRDAAQSLLVRTRL